MPDRKVKRCPKNLPGFAGLKSENFIAFKQDFLAAAEDHRIPRLDHPYKLREVLTGRALKHLPRTCQDMDVAWKALEEAFGDPQTLINHRLRKIKLMSCLTDAVIESDSFDW